MSTVSPATSAVEQQEEDRTAPDESRLAVSLRQPPRLVVIAVVVALLLGGGALYYGLVVRDGSDSTGSAAGRDDALAAARSAAVVLTTLDASAPDESVAEWQDVTTGDLNDAVASGESDFQALISTGDIDTRSSVQEAAVVAFDGEAGTADVLVAVDVTLTPARGRETLERLGLSIAMAHTDDGWKASALTTVTAGAAAVAPTDAEGADVASAIGPAMVELWSYDYRSLSGVDALAPITTSEFLDEYAATYRRIEELAPAAKAVVQAEVTGIAVIAREDDNATVLVFLVQRARKGGADPVDADTRLRVDAELVDGTWRVDGVTPF